MRTLNRLSYNNIHDRVAATKVKLVETQLQLLNHPSNNLIQLERVHALSLADLAQAEVAFLKQKFRINWLKDRD